MPCAASVLKRLAVPAASQANTRASVRPGPSPRAGRARPPALRGGGLHPARRFARAARGPRVTRFMPSLFGLPRRARWQPARRRGTSPRPGWPAVPRALPRSSIERAIGLRCGEDADRREVVEVGKPRGRRRGSARRLIVSLAEKLSGQACAGSPSRDARAAQTASGVSGSRSSGWARGSGARGPGAFRVGRYYDCGPQVMVAGFSEDTPSWCSTGTCLRCRPARYVHARGPLHVACLDELLTCLRTYANPPRVARRRPPPDLRGLEGAIVSCVATLGGSSAHPGSRWRWTTASIG